MYSIEWSRIFSRAKRTDPDPGDRDAVRGRWFSGVSRTVWALGLTSLLTDISSEMVASVLPVYLVLHLGISPLAFGFVDGIYQGAAAVVRIAGGVLADRWNRHKQVATFGYGLSAVCRLMLLGVGSAWGMIAAVIALDRIGKGVRTAPRDALISRRSASSKLATAFGVHRSMDAAGAMLGPVIAFVLLALMPGDFNVLLVVSFGVAIIGLGAIVLFVPSSSPDEREAAETPEAIKTASVLRCPKCAALGPLCSKHISFSSAVRLLREPKFGRLVLVGLLLSLTTVSDSFIYLIFQKRLQFGYSAFPLMYVGTSLFTMLFAIPAGRLADRVGRHRVLISGYILLAVVYLFVLLPLNGGFLLLGLMVLMLGAFYAATDGVLVAMAGSILPVRQIGSGLAVLATVTSLARITASVIYGFLWSRAGIPQATLVYVLALAVAVMVAALMLKRLNHDIRTSTDPTDGTPAKPA